MSGESVAQTTATAATAAPRTITSDGVQRFQSEETPEFPNQIVVSSGSDRRSPIVNSHNNVHENARTSPYASPAPLDFSIKPNGNSTFADSSLGYGPSFNEPAASPACSDARSVSGISGVSSISGSDSGLEDAESSDDELIIDVEED